MGARSDARRARRGAVPRPPRNWAATTEQATLSRPAGDLKAARQAFRSLPSDEQMRLAHELVEARRVEITRAYADVISLDPGYRVQRTRRARFAVRPEVCVTVVVKGKWPKGTPGRHARRVPDHFLTHATVGDRRVLCALPIDVEDGRRLARIRPHTAEQIGASPPDRSRRARGMLACAIIRNGDRDQVYAISCKHVLGMGLDPARHHRADIALINDGRLVGEATPISGRLGNGLPYSFDAQLAQVPAGNHEALRAALDHMAFRDYARDWPDLRSGTEYWILTSHGPVRAEFTGRHTEPIPYPEPPLPTVRHDELARFQMRGGLTGEGDSGAPVTTEPTGGVLVGMYIAGSTDGLAVAIPAWRLLSSSSYALGEERWGLWE